MRKPTNPEVKRDILERKLREDKRSVDRKYRELLRMVEEAERERDASLLLKSNLKTFKIRPSRRVGSEGCVVVLASDWHVEEEVRPQALNGLNEYNLEIAKNRAEAFFRNTRRMLGIFRKDIPINTMALALLGDFISGHIHDELMETTLLSPIEAAIFAQNLIASGIEYLLEDAQLKKIIIPCHCGNHSRIKREYRYSTEAGNSLEFFMYHQLKNHFASEPRVQVMVAEGQHSYLEVYNYTLRFMHGHSVRYYGGVGGLYIPMNKAIAQWDKIRKADYTFAGHFHNFVDGGNFIVNGSMIGYTAYALAGKFNYEPPRQAFVVIDKRRGKTIVCPIVLS